MILNLRGINGSGKTTLVRELMEHFGPTEPILLPNPKERKDGTHPEKIMGYRLFGWEGDRPLRVFGNYENVCGGLDNLAGVNWDWIVAQILKWEDQGHVIVEGAIASTLWGRWAQITEEAHRPFVWTFLDTSFEQCLANIQVRNGGKPIKEESVMAKLKVHERHQVRVKQEGYLERHIRWGHSLEDALAILEEFGDADGRIDRTIASFKEEVLEVAEPL